MDGKYLSVFKKNIMSGSYGKMPIKMQLAFLALSIIVVVLLIIFINYFRIVNIVTLNNSEYINDLTAQIKENISSTCKLYSRVLTNIAYNSVLQDYIMETDENKKFENFSKVGNLMNNMQDMQEGIIDFAIIGDNGSSYFLKGQSEGAISQVMRNTPGPATYFTGQKVIDYTSRPRSCFFVISTVYSISQVKAMGEKIGTAAVIFDTKQLGIEPGNLSRESLTKFYLLDKENTIYSSNDPSISTSEPDVVKSYKYSKPGSYTVKTNNESFIINIESIPEMSGKIMSIVPENKLLSDIIKTRQMVLGIFMLALIILSIPFLFVINNILHPLNKFMDFMSTIKSGNLKGLKKRIQLGGYAEMGVMANEFNSMLDEIDNLTHRLLETTSKLYESELEKKQSELAYLQSQINPHFLYNTLESIKGIANVRGVGEISDMTAAFGQIVRYSIKGVDMVTVDEELSIVKSYIQIQQIRFDDRIDVFYDFTEEVLMSKILKMILQPIVENAVYHGLEPKIDRGCLWISGDMTGDGDIVIKVRDDGVGIDSDTLVNLKQWLLVERDPGSFNGTRIGIFNVNNRIKLTYGSKYGIMIDSVYEKWTEVVLRFPSRRA